MDYVILRANNVKDLEVLVNEWISQGYTPIGGVTYVDMGTSRENSHIQAMLDNKRVR